MLKTNRNVASSILFLLIAVCISICVSSNVGCPMNEHQNFILSGVTSILRTRDPGTISLLNEQAFPILSGVTSGILRAHVAGTEYGVGRIVAYSHTSFYVDGLPNQTISDNIQLFINSANWVGKNSGRKVGMQTHAMRQNLLSENGFDVHILSSSNVNNLTHLEQFDILTLVLDSNINTEILRTYTRNGGGLVISATPWNTNINNMESFFGNIFLRDTGLFYIGRHYSYSTMSCEEGACFNASLEYLRDTHAVHVWNDLKQYNANQTHLPLARHNQMKGILNDRFTDGPRNEILNRDVNEELIRLPTFVPTAATPVTEEHQKYFLLVHSFLAFLLNKVGVTNNMPPHPSAEIFPGVPTEGLTLNKQKLTYRIDIEEYAILDRGSKLGGTARNASQRSNSF